MFPDTKFPQTFWDSVSGHGTKPRRFTIGFVAACVNGNMNPVTIKNVSGKGEGGGRRGREEGEGEVEGVGEGEGSSLELADLFNINTVSLVWVSSCIVVLELYKQNSLELIELSSMNKVSLI